jgi:hypothetical protein
MEEQPDDGHQGGSLVWCKCASLSVRGETGRWPARTVRHLAHPYEEASPQW